MKLCFDSIEEVRDFVKTHLKNPRGGKAGDGEEAGSGQSGGAPALLQPPVSGPAFAAPAGGGAFPNAGPANFGPAPEVMALVQRIIARTKAAVAGGQSAEQALTWFRGQCGPEAANATMEQVETVFLPKLAAPSLENIAKLISA